MGGKESLEGIGARLRELLANEPGAAEDLRQARAGFLDEVERRAASGLRRSSAGGRRGWLALLLSTSVAVGAVALWLWPRPMTFQAGAEPGRLGDLIQASTGRGLGVSFSEGTSLVLHDGGRIRVLSLDAGAARVLVEDGSVDATVAHRARQRTRWQFELGPYRVIVTGTRFRMAFRASDLALRVQTEEGRVTVEGGCLQAVRSVSAGETLESTCPHAAPQPDLPPVAAETPATAGEPRAATPVLRIDRWRELLAAGRLKEGLRAAERANFDQVCRIATAKELLALADAGRFFGASGRAVQALDALRKRFPGSADAGTAAFMLGRIAFDQARAYGEAARWFETYLHEQPRGPLMGDAFGRLMEARLRSGDAAAARTRADDYLRRFPQGPYSSEARGILSQ